MSASPPKKDTTSPKKSLQPITEDELFQTNNNGSNTRNKYDDPETSFYPYPTQRISKNASSSTSTFERTPTTRTTTDPVSDFNESETELENDPFNNTNNNIDADETISLQPTPFEPITSSTFSPTPTSPRKQLNSSDTWLTRTNTGGSIHRRSSVIIASTGQRLQRMYSFWDATINESDGEIDSDSELIGGDGGQQGGQGQGGNGQADVSNGSLDTSLLLASINANQNASYVGNGAGRDAGGGRVSNGISAGLGIRNPRLQTTITVPSISVMTRLANKIKHELQTKYLTKPVLKASIAYLIASLFVYWPFVSDLLGASDSKHLVCTIVVYFHASRSKGSMIQSLMFVMISLTFAFTVSILLMAISAEFYKVDYEEIGRMIDLVLCCVALGLVSFTKQYVNKPTFNTACSLSAIVIISCVIKEGSIDGTIVPWDKIWSTFLIISCP
ncbi:unnamed protein product [Ambrosiozyma monospora]|uniref:Unnamed protein product n=1 Tax=Ambrosiozyma monospora TaxID=43982 RepID=A0ACB5T6R6_AMBMO|nr:unnamed protein product [Ambrosiozyma monospora]